jgi:hypothetical protein
MSAHPDGTPEARAARLEGRDFTQVGSRDNSQENRQGCDHRMPNKGMVIADLTGILHQLGHRGPLSCNEDVSTVCSQMPAPTEAGSPGDRPIGATLTPWDHPEATAPEPGKPNCATSLCRLSIVVMLRK